jgi:hypothetical protein
VGKIWCMVFVFVKYCIVSGMTILVLWMLESNKIIQMCLSTGMILLLSYSHCYVNFKNESILLYHLQICTACVFCNFSELVTSEVPGAHRWWRAGISDRKTDFHGTFFSASLTALLLKIHSDIMEFYMYWNWNKQLFCSFIFSAFFFLK